MIFKTSVSAGWRHVRGWAPNRWIYFHAEFSKPFTAELYVNDILSKGGEAAGKNVKAKLKFTTSANEQVRVKVGISAVDLAGAQRNLTTEMPAWDFDGVVKAAEKLWAKQLSSLEITGGTEAQQKIFYTALYHTAICPNISSDVDGRYRGMDQKIHQHSNYTNYTVFSLWDTFRAQNPLYTIINPDLDQAWIRSLLRKYDEGGILPMWELAANYTGCMIGYHSVSVIGDAYVKGLRDYDLNKAMGAAVFSSVYDDHEGANVLLLDEPTNDLDVNTLRSLEEALEEFAGVALVVSHDRWFLDRICTHLVVFEGDSISKMYIGNWSDYETMMQEKFRKDLTPHRVKYKTLKR